ncbi:MAG: MFS transporter [Lachnospiraceae bacterium]|nr:MFS transporter [Lachnospiraceae bacterium]MBQ2504402.1 MFS transporter [Lachnospiraceae bacterium]MBQ2532591.1 MFS transporter [Lachnospiraceae bacterium]MBQ5387080.1 MFS transporter [Lachnospiraceae bacterium]
MKLKTGQTIRVGFAFLSICAFWQMYNSIIPLILTNTFAMNETISGAIMAADNVLAIFLLPLFGGISDRCKSKMGRRKPFLLYGTLVSVVLMLLLPILDNRYAAAPSAGTKVLFIVVLGCILVSMGTYRSPSVALMPDVTPKPLRSKANAIINLMGAIGGILYLAIATVLYSEKRTAGLDHVNYLPLFMIVAGIMIVGMLIVLITVDEVGLNRQMAEYEAAHPEEQDTVVDASGEEKLPPEVKRSLGLLLASIALWFISYNAMETWFTTYANRMWGMSLGSASLCLTIATLGAILSYIPVGAIASNIGRKKTILSGVVLMTACFVICFVYTLASDHFSPILYVIFAFVGMGWAAINVNSLPMVVEMCKGSDIGRFTGYYYTFSMAAQIVTPIVAGTLMNRVGYTTLFPYAAVFMAAAFVTMIQVKHGDSKLITKKGLEAFDFDD